MAHHERENEMIVINENRAVVINEQDGRVWATLYVNARNGIHDAAITPIRWTGKTIAGAQRWAQRKLAA